MIQYTLYKDTCILFGDMAAHITDMATTSPGRPLVSYFLASAGRLPYGGGQKKKSTKGQKGKKLFN
jgi:hypothetical protein